MRKIYLAVTAIIFSAATLSAQNQAKWNLDPVHSSVRFSVPHMVISDIEGSFKTYNGSIEAAKPDFTDALINFTVDVNSINTDNESRDNHLKGDDFFNAAQYPQMKFQSTSFSKVTDNKYKLSGNLTIRDVTKPVVFDVVYGGSVANGHGGTKAGFKASTTINRFDYNLKWNKLMEAGGATVGKDVTINMNLEFAQAKS